MRDARSNATLVALIVACAFFMENLDGSAVVVVLPQMAATFHTSASVASIGITIYMVALAVLIPISGWGADRMGARNLFCAAIAVFTIASVVCGYSSELWQFAAARAVQGGAAAFMSPVGRIVVLKSAPKHELMRAFGITIWQGLIAPILGQPIGGLIATYATWEWIFFLNVPLGIAAIAAVLSFIDNRREIDRRRLDVVGMVLAAASLSALLYGLDRLSHEAPHLGLTAGLLAVGLFLGVWAVRHAHGHEYGLIDTRLARIQSFSATSIWGGTFFRIAMGAVPFLLPLLFQISFGMTPFDVGILMLTYAGGNLIMKAMTNPILRRFGFRRVLLVNGVLVILSTLSCALLVPGLSIIVIGIVLLVAGGVRSLQFTALNTLAFADIPSTGMSGASTLHAMVQQIAFAFGIALGAVILSVSSELRNATAATMSVADFQIAFVGATILTIVAMPWLVRLAEDAGDVVSGHSARRLARPDRTSGKAA